MSVQFPRNRGTQHAIANNATIILPHVIVAAPGLGFRLYILSYGFSNTANWAGLIGGGGATGAVRSMRGAANAPVNNDLPFILRENEALVFTNNTVPLTAWWWWVDYYTMKL